MRWAIGGSKPEVLWAIEAFRLANVNDSKIDTLALAMKNAVHDYTPVVGEHQTSGYYEYHRVYVELILEQDYVSLHVGTLQFATRYLEDNKHEAR